MICLVSENKIYIKISYEMTHFCKVNDMYMFYDIKCKALE